MKKKLVFFIFLGLLFISFVAQSQEPKDSIIRAKKYFYQGDSLNGFDVAAKYVEIVNRLKNKREILAELYQEETAFVQKKYHIIPKNPSDAINPNNYHVLASTCDNIDFEDGNCTGWVGFIGYNSNSNAPLTTTANGIFNGLLNYPVPSCNYHTIVNAGAGNDPYGGFPVLDPGGGTYALRLGGDNINKRNGGDSIYSCTGGGTGAPGTWGYSGGEIIEQTFLVTNLNALVTYSYAVVLNAGVGHANGQQPYFLSEVLDSANNVIPCLQYYVQINADTIPTGFQLSSKVNQDGTPVYYLTWTSNSFNLSAYIGHNVTLFFAEAGCTLGGHFGYAYVDGSCSVVQITAANTCGSTVLKAPPGAASYAWIKIPSGSGITGSATGQSVTVDQSGTYQVSVMVKPGCSYVIDTTIIVKPIPSFTVSPNDSICKGDSSYLMANGTISYTWLPTFGLTLNSDSVVIASPSVTTTYTVTGSNSFGCTSTQVVKVSLNQQITVNSNSTTICPLDSTTLIATGATIYSWTPSTGLNSSIGASVIANPTALTTYTVTGTSSQGCTSTALAAVSIYPAPTVGVNSGTICLGGNVILTGTGAVTYNWKQAMGLNSTSDTNVIANPLTTTTYTVTGTDANGCTGTAKSIVTVNPLPAAAFTANPLQTTILTSVINFTDASTNAVAWHWNFGDGDTLTWSAIDNNPTHTYADTGIFNVQLIVINQYGCMDSVSIPIDIKPIFTFYAPNAFTPNGDGKNDTFFGTGYGIKTYEMWIFDRWGNLIYHTNDLNGKWNGIALGGTKIAQIGVYVWKVELLDVFDKSHQYIGHVSLVK
ncbi:MAG: gliding motility-associated C-terminal domain-containing protein [Bacteroidia bacterium]